ncbi:MarR family winged helix-turn-helix transcriptional regulator [Roseivivax sediminis]|uniref:DNA-binding transcriptional regulator, MarR family n=1 Tax=Roseivivax sediminis TaxID=936889 RepID=A0A1I2ARG6_9RHOB|nr:MarR family winged helix-turn-helix transcriptional regulator [Roseivivax sediminis]SFE46594.1 DNA-binding transcriptional regulator, MarR family [Roseivivax sediminis]
MTGRAVAKVYRKPKYLCMLDQFDRQSHASTCTMGSCGGVANKTSEPEMDRTDESLVALRRILRATELYGRDLARDAGLTAVQLRVLQIVSERGRCHPSEVAAQMGVSQATISVLIKKLVSYGLIERRQSASDRRQIDLTITSAGRDKVATAPDALQQRYVEQFESLPAWEQAMVVSVLERVAGMLDAGKLDAAPVLAMGEITRMHQNGSTPREVGQKKSAG